MNGKQNLKRKLKMWKEILVEYQTPKGQQQLKEEDPTYYTDECISQLIVDTQELVGRLQKAWDNKDYVGL
jgi:hypothetical protein